MAAKSGSTRAGASSYSKYNSLSLKAYRGSRTDTILNIITHEEL